MRARRCLLLLAVLAIPAGAAARSPDTLIEQWFQAFNGHDADAMANLVSEDVVWWSVDASRQGPELRGREALRGAMRDYFQSVPTVHSESLGMHVSGNYVHLTERVRWHGSDGPREQCSVAVYRVDEGRVHAAWYYPGHTCSVAP